MGKLEEELLEALKNYYMFIGETELGDDDESDTFLLQLIRSVIDLYKTYRDYPDSYTDEMIEEDVLKYFERRKNDVAMTIVPELHGRIGAEGLSMLTDNGITRMWQKSTLLNDVTPICEVV